MSEIGERAEKIWRENSEIIRRKKELVATQIENYANRILDVFEASNEPDYVVRVIVSYNSYNECLGCDVQFFNNNIGEPDNQIRSIVENKKIMEAMRRVEVCEAVDCRIITKIYNLLVANPQVTKYFEVTSDEDSQIVIKMRPEEDVTLDETICENEEPEE